MKKNKILPNFKNEDEEREFWAKHDFTKFTEDFTPIDLDLSELKPSTRSVTFRITESLLNALKMLANKRDVPYQSLMKILLTEKVEEEMKLKGI